MSGAVPLNRRRSDRAGLDYFPTPPWATRALCEWLKRHKIRLSARTVWEPACGEGYMTRPLGEYFGRVIATDIHDRRATFPDQDAVSDFLLDWPDPDRPAADWIVTNPPFNNAEDFVRLALERAAEGVAILVKQQFLEGVGRYRGLWSRYWPTWVLQFAERVPILENRVDPEASTNQSYIWVVWIRDGKLRDRIQGGEPGARINWLAPCRRDLERPHDYRAPAPDAPAEPLPLFDGPGAG